MLDQLAKLDPAKLSPEDRQRLQDIRDRLASAEERRAILDAEEEAERRDPAKVLKAADQLIEQRQRENALREAQRAGAAVYEAECEKRGASLVARVDTAEGPIVLVSLDRDTLREMYKRVEELQRAGKHSDADEIAESYIDGAVVYPPAERLAELTARFPLLRADLMVVLRQLANGRATAVGNAG